MTGTFQQFLTKLGNTSGRSATRRSGILHVPALVVLRRGIHHHHHANHANHVNHVNHVNGIRSKLHMNGSLSQTHAQTQTQTRSVFSYEDEDADMMQQEKEQEQEVLSQKEIADMIADEHDLTNAKAQRIVKGIFDTIAESVTEGNTVRITGFGKFTKRHSKERMGRNPSLNEPMLIPPKNRVKFSAYKAFKDSLNE